MYGPGKFVGFLRRIYGDVDKETSFANVDKKTIGKCTGKRTYTTLGHHVQDYSQVPEAMPETRYDYLECAALAFSSLSSYCCGR